MSATTLSNLAPLNFTNPEIVRFENRICVIAMEEICKRDFLASLPNKEQSIVQFVYISHFRFLFDNLIWLITEGELSFLKNYTREISIEFMDFLTSPLEVEKTLRKYATIFNEEASHKKNDNLTKIDQRKYIRSFDSINSLVGQTFNLSSYHFNYLIKSFKDSSAAQRYLSGESMLSA